MRRDATYRVLWQKLNLRGMYHDEESSPQDATRVALWRYTNGPTTFSYPWDTDTPPHNCGRFWLSASYVWPVSGALLGGDGAP